MQRPHPPGLRRLPLLFAVSPLRAQPALRPTPQDNADVARVEAYLNNIHTLRAQFLQVAPDGQITRGTVWLERPGHMRFQYDPPTPFLLVTSHGQLVFEDRSIQQVSEIPLSTTPLGILLADHVSLSGDVTVTASSICPARFRSPWFAPTRPATAA